MSTVKSRLIANFGANTFGRISTVIIQIVVVPVMLSHWGAGLYGEWILLSTIPNYLGMSDIGFGNVAGNDMTMLVAAGKQQEALNVFQSANLFISGISLSFGLLFALGVWVLPLEKWLRTTLIAPHDARIILVVLAISGVFSLQENLFHNVFQCVGKKALGTTVKSIVSLAVFLGQMVAVALGANVLTVAIATVVISAIGTVALWIVLRVSIPWIHFGVEHARFTIVRRLFWPAVSFMSFPLSNILSLQGILMVIGHVFGPIGVVTFSTARTISRSVLQALQLINASVWPEVSAAFGSGSMVLLRKLHRTSCQLSVILCALATAVAAGFGNQIWKIWTLGKFHTDPVLLNILLLQMLIGSVWYTSSVVPAATNNHRGIAKVILCGSAMSLVISYPLMKIGFIGLRGAAMALVMGDIFIAIFVLRSSLRLVEDTFPMFCRSLIEIPAIPYRRR